MTYRVDTLIEKSLTSSADLIAHSRIKRADENREWTMGKATTKAEKRRWIAVGYFPRLIEKLDNLKQEMSEYIKEQQK